MTREFKVLHESPKHIEEQIQLLIEVFDERLELLSLVAMENGMLCQSLFIHEGSYKL